MPLYNINVLNISEINIHHRASNAFAMNAQVFIEITEISVKEYQWNCLNVYLVMKCIMCGMTIAR